MGASVWGPGSSTPVDVASVVYYEGLAATHASDAAASASSASASETAAALSAASAAANEAIVSAISTGIFQLALRNRIVNGALAIDQRNSGSSQTFTAAAAIAYCIDRWYGYCTGANCTGQRVAGTAPDQYNYRFTGAASVTAINFGQRIKAADVYDLASTTVTLSVKLANSLLTSVTWKAFYANAADDFTAKTLITSGTFTVNASLTRYSTAIALPASVTNGLCIEFSVGAQTSGTWNIAEVQLEAGAYISTFERRPNSLELGLCKHYYQKVVFSGRSYAPASWTYGFVITFPEMRATPTATTIAAGTSSNVSSPTCTPNSAYSAYLQWISTAAGDSWIFDRIYSLSAEL